MDTEPKPKNADQPSTCWSPFWRAPEDAAEAAATPTPKTLSTAWHITDVQPVKRRKRYFADTPVELLYLARESTPKTEAEALKEQRPN